LQQFSSEGAMQVKGYKSQI